MGVLRRWKLRMICMFAGHVVPTFKSEGMVIKFAMVTCARCGRYIVTENKDA